MMPSNQVISRHKKKLRRGSVSNAVVKFVDASPVSDGGVTVQQIETHLRKTYDVDGLLDEPKGLRHVVKDGVKAAVDTGRITKEGNLLKPTSGEATCRVCTSDAPEVMLGCSSCGYSAHPSCMKYAEGLMQELSNRDGQWQCLSCRVCAYCDKKKNKSGPLISCSECDTAFHGGCNSTCDEDEGLQNGHEHEGTLCKDCAKKHRLRYAFHGGGNSICDEDEGLQNGHEHEGTLCKDCAKKHRLRYAFHGGCNSTCDEDEGLQNGHEHEGTLCKDCAKKHRLRYAFHGGCNSTCDEDEGLQNGHEHEGTLCKDCAKKHRLRYAFHGGCNSTCDEDEGLQNGHEHEGTLCKDCAKKHRLRYAFHGGCNSTCDEDEGLQNGHEHEGTLCKDCAKKHRLRYAFHGGCNSTCDEDEGLQNGHEHEGTLCKDCAKKHRLRYAFHGGCNSTCDEDEGLQNGHEHEGTLCKDYAKKHRLRYAFHGGCNSTCDEDEGLQNGHEHEGTLCKDYAKKHRLRYAFHGGCNSTCDEDEGLQNGHEHEGTLCKDCAKKHRLRYAFHGGCNSTCDEDEGLQNGHEHEGTLCKDCAKKHRRTNLKKNGVGFDAVEQIVLQKEGLHDSLSDYFTPKGARRSRVAQASVASSVDWCRATANAVKDDSPPPLSPAVLPRSSPSVEAHARVFRCRATANAVKDDSPPPLSPAVLPRSSPSVEAHARVFRCRATANAVKDDSPPPLSPAVLPRSSPSVEAHARVFRCRATANAVKDDSPPPLSPAVLPRSSPSVEAHARVFRCRATANAVKDDSPPPLSPAVLPRSSPSVEAHARVFRCRATANAVKDDSPPPLSPAVLPRSSPSPKMVDDDDGPPDITGGESKPVVVPPKKRQRVEPIVSPAISKKKRPRQEQQLMDGLSHLFTADTNVPRRRPGEGAYAVMGHGLDHLTAAMTSSSSSVSVASSDHEKVIETEKEPLTNGDVIAPPPAKLRKSAPKSPITVEIPKEVEEEKPIVISPPRPPVLRSSTAGPSSVSVPKSEPEETPRRTRKKILVSIDHKSSSPEKTPGIVRTLPRARKASLGGSWKGRRTIVPTLRLLPPEPQFVSKKRVKSPKETPPHEDPVELTQLDEKLYKDTKAKAQKNLSKNVVKDDILRCPTVIQFGRYLINTWYTAPYPEEYIRLKTLFICEYCLKYMKSHDVLSHHATSCEGRHPPGLEIYRRENISIFEVDGNTAQTYCRHLCLLAKLFLDHKTLYYDVEPFMFYILCVTDADGCHLVGYFSKEKYSAQRFNVSCIVTLPVYQKKGYGRFLIDFSYLLSRIENQPGTPEKPLSDLGKLSYRAYWRSTILEHLSKKKCPKMTIRSISRETGIAPVDAVETLHRLGLIATTDKRVVLRLNAALIHAHMEKMELHKSRRIPLDSGCLRWAPVLSSPLRSPEPGSDTSMVSELRARKRPVVADLNLDDSGSSHDEPDDKRIEQEAQPSTSAAPVQEEPLPVAPAPESPKSPEVKEQLKTPTRTRKPKSQATSRMKVGRRRKRPLPSDSDTSGAEESPCRKDKPLPKSSPSSGSDREEVPKTGRRGGTPRSRRKEKPKREKKRPRKTPGSRPHVTHRPIAEEKKKRRSKEESQTESEPAVKPLDLEENIPEPDDTKGNATSDRSQSIPDSPIEPEPTPLPNEPPPILNEPKAAEESDIDTDVEIDMLTRGTGKPTVDDVPPVLSPQTSSRIPTPFSNASGHSDEAAPPEITMEGGAHDGMINMGGEGAPVETSNGASPDASAPPLLTETENVGDIPSVCPVPSPYASMETCNAPPPVPQPPSQVEKQVIDPDIQEIPIEPLPQPQPVQVQPPVPEQSAGMPIQNGPAPSIPQLPPAHPSLPSPNQPANASVPSQQSPSMLNRSFESDNRSHESVPRQQHPSGRTPNESPRRSVDHTQQQQQPVYNGTSPGNAYMQSPSYAPPMTNGPTKSPGYAAVSVPQPAYGGGAFQPISAVSSHGASQYASTQSYTPQTVALSHTHGGSSSKKHSSNSHQNTLPGSMPPQGPGVPTSYFNSFPPATYAQNAGFSGTRYMPPTPSFQDPTYANYYAGYMNMPQSRQAYWPPGYSAGVHQQVSTGFGPQHGQYFGARPTTTFPMAGHGSHAQMSMFGAYPSPPSFQPGTAPHPFPTAAAAPYYLPPSKF